MMVFIKQASIIYLPSNRFKDRNQSKYQIKFEDLGYLVIVSLHHFSTKYQYRLNVYIL